MIKNISPPANIQKNWWERVYILEIIRGLWVTLTHLARNLFNLPKGRVGDTYQWPETKKPIAEVWRGEHRLMQRDNGGPRCVACNCCATACPAECIHITAQDTGGSPVEKFPITFDIDVLQCIYCGMCVEACPCDAIRMDTRKFVESDYAGPIRILSKEYLLNNHPEGKSPLSEAVY